MISEGKKQLFIKKNKLHKLEEEKLTAEEFKKKKSEIDGKHDSGNISNMDNIRQ